MGRLPAFGSRALRRAPRLVTHFLVLSAALLSPQRAWAASYSTTIQPDTATSDAHLWRGNATQLSGTKTHLDLEATNDGSNYGIVLQIPIGGLADRTILQAWLRLSHTGGVAATPIDSRVYPLTESWLEPEVSWQNRFGATAWSRAGGTRGDDWTDRVLVSDATVGGEVSWQIGPLVQAWQLGTLPNHGVLIEADTLSATRTAAFAASETATATDRPRFVIYSTDEPPAVREGRVEIQPRAVRAGATSVPMTLWLDVDAVSATPSGDPTGFDALTLNHGGALAVTAITGLEVDGTAVPTDLVDWTDTGTATSFRLPLVRTHGRVRLDFLVTVLAAGTLEGVAMPVTVDDTATPGCWAQSLWPGDADGTTGDGDGVLVVISASDPIRIVIEPDTVTVRKKDCTNLTVWAEDESGNLFTIVPDAFTVSPVDAGTLDVSGTFCARTVGGAIAVAAYGALRDTAVITIADANLPQIDGIAVLDRLGTPATTLVPGDTMLVDVSLHDADGFLDIRQIDLVLAHALHESESDAPALRAQLRWNRHDSPMWSLRDPAGSSWAIVPDLCVADTATNAVSAKSVRFAFVVGGIARASLTGEWEAMASVVSDSPADTTLGSLTGLDVAARVELAVLDTAAVFGAGLAGATGLPLVTPADGRVALRVQANADYDLRGSLTHLAGLVSTSDTIRVRADSQTVAWAPNEDGTDGGYLTPETAVLLSGTAPTDEAAIEQPLYLWVRHPASITAQGYRGSLSLQATLPTAGASTGVSTLPVTAHVAAGLAATSAVAEVTPHTVAAGATGAVFDAYFLPEVGGGDSGVNHLEIAVPEGYGVPAVASVRIAGASVPFRDYSIAGAVRVTMSTRVADGRLARVRFAMDAPTLADSLGAEFAVSYDDTATSTPAQGALEGDANSVADGDDWDVQVLPGAVAVLSVAPDSVVCAVDTTIAFGASGTDAHGNAVAPTVSWSVTGGIGTATSDGAFTPTRPGAGFVVASSGAVADSAAVTVTAGLAATAVLAEIVPATAVAGAAGAVFDVCVMPEVNVTDTGVNRVGVDVPPGYGVPAAIAARVGGSAVAFHDASVPGRLIVTVGRQVADGQLLRVRFRVDVPTGADATGADFVVSCDDTATAAVAQVATEGDADGVNDGDTWRVRVLPAALAHLLVTPDPVVCEADSVIAFTATGTDAYGNGITPVVSWSVTGGIGIVDVDGMFQARSPGSGHVIATSGTVADSAAVTVSEPPAIALRSVRGGSALVPGETGAPLTVRIENLSPDSVLVDTLALAFTRVARGDADGDFVVTGPSLPLTLAAGAVASVPLTVDVSASAAVGPLLVDATVAGYVPARAARVRDASADTVLALALTAGRIGLSAARAATSAHPGEAGVAVLALHLENRYPAQRRLTGLRLANATAGPGTVAQRDAELGAVALYRDDGDGAPDSTTDVLLGRASLADGAVDFAPLAVILPPDQVATLFAVANVSLRARRGDVLDLAVAAADDVTLDPVSTVSADWPLDLAGGVTVDGMVADQILLEPVPGGTVNPGTTDRQALSVTLPANGYLPDTLEGLAVDNLLGTAAAGEDVARIRSWVDDGDGAFEPLEDRPLGVLPFTGSRWQLTGLAEPVPLAGLRVHFSADFAALAGEGRTLQLELSAAPGAGVVMASGGSGPQDRPVANPDPLTVTNSDRVTVVALPVTPGSARPGARGLVLMKLEAVNTYAALRTLTDLTVADVTTGTGTTAQLDAEARTVALRDDGDGDGALDSTDVDPVLATGYFEGGAVRFTGLSWVLTPGVARRLFVTADLSPAGAADGDVIGAVVREAASIGFEEPATTAATWPLDGGGRWTVDGLVAAQVTAMTVAGSTLSPGDGPVLALDLLLPPNGYRADVLRGVRVVNLGTAAADDIALVQVWRDGGDGVFSAGTGDDVLLGAMTTVGGGWQSPLLAEAVAAGPARLFVSVTLAEAAAESVTVRLAVPVGGIENESGNDGPADLAIENPEAILVSTSALLATLQAPTASTVGQSVTVRMVVRNVGTEIIRGVVPSSLDQSGNGAVTFVAGPSPTQADIAPAAADTFTWTATSAAAGDVRFVGGAAGTGDPSGLARSAPPVSSGQHRVYLGASRIELTPVMTMPVSVSRGQSDVVPMSLTFSNPGGSEASDVRLSRLTLQVQDESGAGIVPAQLFGRVVVNEGTNVYLVRTSLETSGSTVDLTLATPAMVSSSQPATLNLRFDVLAGTTVPSFRVVLADSSAVEAADATSGAPTGLALVAGTYPVRSEVARVVAEATELVVDGVAMDTVRVAPGAAALPLLRAQLESPGVTGISSDVRLVALAVALDDGAGAGVPATGRLGALSVRSGSQVLLTRAIGTADTSAVELTLSLPLNLPVNTPTELVVEGSLSPDAAPGGFRMALLDSAHVEARDASTRARVAVHYAAARVAGGWVLVESRADSLRVDGRAALPPALLVGQSGVTAMTATLRHPGGTGTGRIRVDSLSLECRDESRNALAPGTYLARVAVRWNGAERAAVTALPVSGSGVTVPLPDALLAPGDSATVAIVLDVRATAPAGTLELMLSGAGVRAVDANSGGAVAVRTADDLPVLSGLASLQAPARQLSVGLVSMMPAVLRADGNAVRAAELSLRNSDPMGAGTIQVAYVVVRAADRAFGTASLGAAAERVQAWRHGALWAESAALSADSVTAVLGPTTPLALAPGEAARLELRIVPRADASAASLRVGCDESDIGVVQPVSALLTVSVQPEAGSTFPLWSEAGGFTGAGLEASYSNFPNPFAAGREATTIVFDLPGPGRVSLRILTVRGEPVATLMDGAPRAAGLHQEDRWDGRNGAGATVTNGVYVAELTVRFDDGTSRKVLRKVAVVR